MYLKAVSEIEKMRLVMEEDDGRGLTITITITIASTFSPPPGVEHCRLSTFALCWLPDAEKETTNTKCCGRNVGKLTVRGTTLKMSLYT